MAASEWPCTWNVAVSSVSLEFGRYEVLPLADVIVIVPGTSTVLLVIGAPLVLIVTIGRLICEAAGANEGFDNETVSAIGAKMSPEPSTPTTDTEFVLLFASEYRGSVALKPSWSAEAEALRSSVPDPPEVSVSGVKV